MARDTVEALLSHPLLTARDKRGILGLLAKTVDLGAVEKQYSKSTTWTPVSNISGINITRELPVSPERVYRVSGVGQIDAPPELVFELVSSSDLYPEWDMLFKGAKYLGFAVSNDGLCEVAHLHVTYGLPGFSRIVHDRDFVIRAVRMQFPSGIRVLYCHSVSEQENVEGDPAPLPHTLRAHMGDSGYVVVPTSLGCIMNFTLQVDPKGWIPTSVVNFSLEAVTLNIQRIRSALQRLPEDVLTSLRQINSARKSSAAALKCKRKTPSGTTCWQEGGVMRTEEPGSEGIHGEGLRRRVLGRCVAH